MKQQVKHNSGLPEPDRLQHPLAAQADDCPVAAGGLADDVTHSVTSRENEGESSIQPEA